MNVVITDLSAHIGPDELTLIGFDRGLKLRNDCQLDSLKRHSGAVSVIFPVRVHTIDVSFMEGLLFEVVFNLGSIAFEKLWSIEVPGTSNCDDIISRAVARIMDKRAAFG